MIIIKNYFIKITHADDSTGTWLVVINLPNCSWQLFEFGLQSISLTADCEHFTSHIS